MTRKHFESLAAAIRYMTLDMTTKQYVAEAIADVCALHNSGFKRGRFMEACGL